MRYTSQQAFGLLMSTSMYFTPFKWKVSPVPCVYKGTPKNRLYMARKKTLEHVVSLYYPQDVDSLVYGMFLQTSNPMDIAGAEWSKCIQIWNHTKNKLSNIAKSCFQNEKPVINNILDGNTIDFSIEKIKSKAEEIGFAEISSEIVLGGGYDALIKLSSETRSLENFETYSRLFRHLQLLKLVSREEEKTEKRK